MAIFHSDENIFDQCYLFDHICNDMMEWDPRIFGTIMTIFIVGNKQDTNNNCYNIPSDWQDITLKTCSDYEMNQVCGNQTISDKFGTNYLNLLSDHSNYNLSGTDVCCACGGGMLSYQNVLNYSVNIDFSMDFGDDVNVNLVSIKDHCVDNIGTNITLVSEFPSLSIVDLYQMCQRMADYTMNNMVNHDYGSGFKFNADYNYGYNSAAVIVDLEEINMKLRTQCDMLVEPLWKLNDDDVKSDIILCIDDLQQNDSNNSYSMYNSFILMTDVDLQMSNSDSDHDMIFINTAFMDLSSLLIRLTNNKINYKNITLTDCIEMSKTKNYNLQIEIVSCSNFEIQANASNNDVSSGREELTAKDKRWLYICGGFFIVSICNCIVKRDS